jgi:hypothetical protein
MNTRRDFLRTTGLYTAGFLELRALAGRALFGAKANPVGAGFGPLLDDVAGRLRLPHGFCYTLFSLNAGNQLLATSAARSQG